MVSIGLSCDQGNSRPPRKQGDRVAVCRYGQNMGLPCGRFATSMVVTTHHLAELRLWSHRIGPEKGVIPLATAAVDNALWDLYARTRQKPLWKLIVDMSPVRPGLC